jgi:hypothetical protein
MQALAPILGAILNNNHSPSAPVPAPEWQQPFANNRYFATNNDPYTSVPHLQSQPSFLGKRAAEDVPATNLCPDIATWLKALDSDPVRGCMMINYSQFHDTFLANGFFELSDVAMLSAEQLVAVCNGGMNFGESQTVSLPTRRKTSHRS